jgi:hypothetical protein
MDAACAEEALNTSHMAGTECRDYVMPHRCVQLDTTAWHLLEWQTGRHHTPPPSPPWCGTRGSEPPTDLGVAG